MSGILSWGRTLGYRKGKLVGLQEADKDNNRLLLGTLLHGSHKDCELSYREGPLGEDI